MTLHTNTPDILGTLGFKPGVLNIILAGKGTSRLATRSSIGILESDGTVTAQYVHFDGYLSHVGQILKDHYSDPQKLRQLSKLGALSQLRPEIGEQHTWSNPNDQPDWCVAYGRDRGEDDVGPYSYVDVTDWLRVGQEYNYLWNGEEWFVSCSLTKYNLRSLIQVMLEQE